MRADTGTTLTARRLGAAWLESVAANGGAQPVEHDADVATPRIGRGCLRRAHHRRTHEARDVLGIDIRSQGALLLSAADEPLDDVLQAALGRRELRHLGAAVQALEEGAVAGVGLRDLPDERLERGPGVRL